MSTPETLKTFLTSPYLEPLPGFPPNPERSQCLSPSIIDRLQAFEKQREEALRLVRKELCDLIKVPVRLIHQRNPIHSPSLVDGKVVVDIGDPHSANGDGVDFSEYETAVIRISGIPKDEWEAREIWDQKVIALASALRFLGETNLTFKPSRSN